MVSLRQVVAVVAIGGGHLGALAEGRCGLWLRPSPAADHGPPADGPHA